MSKYVIRVTEVDENGVEQPVKDLEQAQRMEADGLCLILIQKDGSTNMFCDTSVMDVAAAIASDKTLYRAAQLGVAMNNLKEVDSDAAT